MDSVYARDVARRLVDGGETTNPRDGAMRRSDLAPRCGRADAVTDDETNE